MTDRNVLAAFLDWYDPEARHRDIGSLGIASNFLTEMRAKKGDEIRVGDCRYLDRTPITVTAFREGVVKYVKGHHSIHELDLGTFTGITTATRRRGPDSDE